MPLTPRGRLVLGLSTTGRLSKGGAVTSGRVSCFLGNKTMRALLSDNGWISGTSGVEICGDA